LFIQNLWEDPVGTLPPPPDIESQQYYFPLSHLSSYIFILMSSLAVCIIHLCMYLDALIHAFYIYTFPVLLRNSVFCICDIFSDFLRYLYYHFCHMVCLSYIWLLSMKYPCIVFLTDNVLNSTCRRTRNGWCLSLDLTLDQIKFWMREKFTWRNNT